MTMTAKMFDAIVAEEKALKKMEARPTSENIKAWRAAYKHLVSVQNEEQEERPEPAHWQGE